MSTAADRLFEYLPTVSNLTVNGTRGGTELQSPSHISRMTDSDGDVRRGLDETPATIKRLVERAGLTPR